MSRSKTTQQELARQIAAVRKRGGKNLVEERELYQGEMQWQFRGVTIGAKELVTYEMGRSWATGRMAVYVKADVGKPSRWGGRGTVSRQYSSKDISQNTRKAFTVAEEFATILAENKTVEHTRDEVFGVETARVEKLLGRDLPSWVRFEPTTKGEIRFFLGTRTVTPEQACAIIQALDTEAVDASLGRMP